MKREHKEEHKESSLRASSISIKPSVKTTINTYQEMKGHLSDYYDAFVADMVYATKANTPSFREALNVFSKTLRNTLSLITSANIESEMMQVLRLKN